MNHIRVTVDLVLFTIKDARLQVLLVRRGIPPFDGWTNSPTWLSITPQS
jgi:ADP-ribose pyrophosphatase YjhB (NUDIX family)